jgi:D-serine deaminase-like pyridoxal phosphate-dependent protein
MSAQIFEKITKPTFLLDESKAKQNLITMAAKAQKQNIRFRPHFKTHQSRMIGAWFRDEGVAAITVSSIDMAMYFAEDGWNDITIAFPVNRHQITDIQELSKLCRLGLVIEDVDTVRFLSNHLDTAIDFWIKIDTGYHRTGISWDAVDTASDLGRIIQVNNLFRFRGLLTHSGHTYHAQSAKEIQDIYAQTVQRMNILRAELGDRGFFGLEISVGDTPGCSLVTDFGEVDEIRPGNFIFYDMQQRKLEVCKDHDIAVALACPVVAVHPERGEVVIHGGAVHLAKDAFEDSGRTVFGAVCLPDGNGWGEPIPDAYVIRLSQEHGVIKMPFDRLEKLQVGDWVCVLPAHSCLTLHAMRSLTGLSGQIYSTLLSC